MSRKTAANGKQDNSLKGIHIQTISLWLVGVTLAVSVMMGIGIFRVMNKHQNLLDMTKEYILAQEEAKNLLLGSNYLTDQVRLYAVTGDYSYAEAYFQEAEETKRRDKALSALEENLQGRDEAAIEMSRQAMKLSNELMDLEIHSMKLVALSVGEKEDRIHPRIREYVLSKEELAGSREEKLSAATELVFGDEYQDRKRQIEEELLKVTENVIQICEKELKESVAEMRKCLIRQSVYTGIVVLLVLLSYVMIAVLILRPIRIYVNCIKNNNFLEITGAYEFKYLAATYNNVYEMTLEQQDILRQRAEKDALTGLLNRQAFEQVKNTLKGSAEGMAFLLIDVDVFKSINDTYGHDVGDQALIRVASLLKENFRKGDYVLRIGGDEFAVIMEGMTADKKQTIREKINQINRILQHPQGDFPSLSLSVGVSFSLNGFHDELFRQTDQALYHTKENGRCGYTFYDEIKV